MIRVVSGRARPDTDWSVNKPSTIHFRSMPAGLQDQTSRSLRNTIITISQSHHDSSRNISRDADLESGDGSFDSEVRPVTIQEMKGTAIL